MSIHETADPSLQAIANELKQCKQYWQEKAIAFPLPDDHSLKRFLYARQLDVEKAMALAVACLEYRKEHNLDAVPIPVELNGPIPFIVTLRRYPDLPEVDWTPEHPQMPPSLARMWQYMGGNAFHGVSKQGEPVFIDRVGLTDVKGLAQNCTINVMKEYHVRNHEYLINVVMQKQSERFNKVIDKVCM